MKSRFKNYFTRRPTANERQPRFETLEIRTVFDGSGSWDEASALTISFPADATQVGSFQNNINQFFAGFGAPEWKTSVLRGFQVWAAQTNVNIGVVSDDNSPLGSRPINRNDLQFGDIRVAAAPMSSNVLAISIPQDKSIAGSWSGDLIFNSNAKFNSVDEIFRVTIHEAGHVLGLEHNPDPNSPMFAHGISASTTPTADDIAALIARYGSRGPDRNELDVPNDTPAKASKIRFSDDAGFAGETPALEYGEITTAADVDYFQLENLSNYIGTVEIEIYSKGLSQLSFSAQLLDKSGNVLQSVDSVNATGSAILTTNAADIDAGRFVRIRSSGGGDTAVGAYVILQKFVSNLTAPPDKIRDTVIQGHRLIAAAPAQTDHVDLRRLFANPHAILNDDNGLDDTELGANTLKPAIDSLQMLKYQTLGSIANLSDKDFYSVKSGIPTNANKPQVLTIELESLDPQGLLGKITLRDRNGVTLTPQTIINGQGLLVVQLVGVETRKNYQIIVESDSTASSFALGNYRLAARFDQTPSQLQTLATVELSAAKPQEEMVLYVAQTQLMQLGLRSEQLTGASSDVPVWIAVFDSKGKAVYYNAAHLGETRTTQSIPIQPGEYHIQLAVDPSRVASDTTLKLELFGERVSRPLGPPVLDPNNKPIYTIPGQPDVFAYPNGTTTADPSVVVPPITPILPPPVPLPTIPADGWRWTGNTPRTNPILPVDTNGDGLVTPIDALVVINLLNSQGAGPVAPPPQVTFFYDSNGDNLITPIDVLVVINYLNRNSGQGEGEGSIGTTVSTYGNHNQPADLFWQQFAGNDFSLEQLAAAEAAWQAAEIARKLRG